jgi:hypothetical protein
MTGAQKKWLAGGVGMLLASSAVLVWRCNPSGTVLMSMGLVLAQLTAILVPLYHPRALIHEEQPVQESEPRPPAR